MNGRVDVALLAHLYCRAAVLAVMLWGCGSSEEKTPPAATDAGVSGADAAVIASLDSCNRESNLVSHWSGNARLFRQFALFIPDSARVTNPGADLSQLDLTWPRGGEHCRFSVSVYSDSGISLEARVTQMVGAQRRIDSVNQDSATEIGEFDELDAPPRPVKTANASGYVIDHSCGDCAATTLKFGHASLIADVSVTADASPGAAQWMCEMMVVAKSFAWRP